MRIWSLHPKYLDAKGLVALWRETLLARHVLQGRTKGYTRHPQLLRFMEVPRPVDAIDQYLAAVHVEAVQRGYHFDRTKFDPHHGVTTVTVTTGQLAFEMMHLLNKLKTRDPARHEALKQIRGCEPHPLFKVVEGGVAAWEKV